MPFCLSISDVLKFNATNFAIAQRYLDHRLYLSERSMALINREGFYCSGKSYGVETKLLLLMSNREINATACSISGRFLLFP